MPLILQDERVVGVYVRKAEAAALVRERIFVGALYGYADTQSATVGSRHGTIERSGVCRL